MTLATTSTKAVAQGNGANTSWPFTFLIPAMDSIVVSLVDIASGNITPIAPAYFSVTGLGNPTGGAVTYPLSGTPVAATSYVVVQRIVPDTQETDFTLQGAVYPTDIEDALDYVTMICQQLQGQINQSIVFSPADTVTPVLPSKTARANLYLAFDSNGDPIATAGPVVGTTVSAAMIPVVTAPTTAQALTALGLPGALLDLLIPSGTVWDYAAGGSAPTGFAFPIGQACTSTYPDYRAKLIAAGSPYGTNGVDPLMPDLRSVVVAGKSNMGGVDNGLLPGGTVLGALLGSATRILLTSNLPPYTPSGSIIPSLATRVWSNAGVNDIGTVAQGNSGGVLSSPNNAPGANMSFTGAAQGGTSVAFGIVQPTLICNKIIKVH